MQPSSFYNDILVIRKIETISFISSQLETRYHLIPFINAVWRQCKQLWLVLIGMMRELFGIVYYSSLFFFHNCRLIRQIDLTRDWTKIPYLDVSYSSHYTRMFSVFLWGCNWILFMHGVILSNSSNSSNWTKICSVWKKLDWLMCSESFHDVSSC